LWKCKWCLKKFEEIEANVTYSSAKPSRIDSFMKLIAPFGILESARTGLMALPRSPLYGPKEEEMLKEADDIVDASSLPPG
jgi:acetolactate synthase-1/3 small subunit